MIKKERIDELRGLLNLIYGTEKGTHAFNRILPLIEGFPIRKAEGEGFFSQKDVVLITYGDTLKKERELPLAAFRRFAREHLKGVVSVIHFLPFFPYSSDDGFSVMDFFTINPEFGSWEDVADIGNDFDLMFDYVINHFSAKSQWFNDYLAGKQEYKDFAIEVDPSADLSMVNRPRTLPLLTEFKKKDGKTVHIWTTFSADQIDFNYESLAVFEKMVKVLLFYAKQGASFLRLDAVGFLWKEIGTTCIHLPQTHHMVKVFRRILDIVAPDVVLITETNVPHKENISYFGNGRDEAQMVYNFTLPPLLFHSFVTEDATAFSQWVKNLHLESGTNTFFNFTASHDGIGLRPLEGILPPTEIDRLVEIVKANGGKVSYRKKPDGSETPYELNITYVDAILGDRSSHQTEKFLASQAIQLALPGVPAIYIHSLLGSRNWIEGVAQTGHARTINREKLQVEDVLMELNNSDSFRSKIFFPYVAMIKTRRRQPAFHPNAGFEILEIAPKVFGIKRFCKEQTIFALTNISSQPVSVSLPDQGFSGSMSDLLTGESVREVSFTLEPYRYLWLVKADKKFET